MTDHGPPDLVGPPRLVEVSATLLGELETLLLLLSKWITKNVHPTQFKSHKHFTAETSDWKERGWGSCFFYRSIWLYYHKINILSKHHPPPGDKRPSSPMCQRKQRPQWRGLDVSFLFSLINHFLYWCLLTYVTRVVVKKMWVNLR
jgi:hypothetical protein